MVFAASVCGTACIRPAEALDEIQSLGSKLVVSTISVSPSQ